MSNEFPVTVYFTNADALFTAKLCVDSQQKYFVPILAGNLLPFEIVLKVLKAVGEKNHTASRGYALFENIIEILFGSYMIKFIGNFNTVLRNNYTVIAAKKKVVQGVAKGNGRKSSWMLQISQNTFYKVIEPFSTR
ncbi:MAG: hypothetical protein UHL70_05885 [Acutalibacteraceae bacterium]|nr:hypothetical protein [Acutalibacteraceae bacterium]